MLGAIGKLLGGGLVDSIGGIVKAVAGDKTQREANIHAEQSGATAGMVAEAVAAASVANRTWWDSLVDGLNRLPRPILAFMILSLFAYCFADPAGFSVRMQAFGLVPEWLAIIMGQVILLYMGGRMLDNWKGGGGPSKEQVAAVLTSMRDLRKLAHDNAAEDASAKPITETAYQAEVRDTSKPMSLKAIEEWNRRRNAG